MAIFENARRIVIKIGTSSLTHDTGKFNLQRMETLAMVLSDLKNSGKEIILVTSAAITAGMARMGISKRPENIAEKQAMAAVGQCELMRMYERFFESFGHSVAQVLVTREIISNEHMKFNTVNTLNALIRMGCLPIVNENDTVSCEEIEFGDNDTLSAHVAAISSSDALVLLSDIDGLYDADPRTNSSAELISEVKVIDERILGYAGGAGTSRGTGGLITKLHAAQIAWESGIPVFLMNGKNPADIYGLFSGECRGTYFPAPVN